MSSRSATVLVIFIVAVIAFCFASVFAAMTGPISILPVENESEMLLENLSISDDSSSNVYTYKDNSHSDSSDDSNVETTTDSSQSSSNQKDNSHQDTPSPTPTPTPPPSTDDSGSHEGGDSSIETTTG